MPLDVDKGIELPQLELISTKNDDCTTEYSTGKKPIAIIEIIKYFGRYSKANFQWGSKVQDFCQNYF